MDDLRFEPRLLNTDNRARRDSPAAAEFAARATSLRTELFVHCYRMVGSTHDAEDLVQETFLRAWQGLDDFEGRSSLRTWLYRIATNVCMNALASGRRRAVPVDVAMAADPADPVLERADLLWLEPLPGARAGLGADGPEGSAVARESVRLAFVAAMQRLPPRQRAVLLLRDVLQFTAADTAEILETTSIAVNSALLRARDRLARSRPTPMGAPLSSEVRRVLDAYVAAWESKDVAAIVALLRADAVWEMPPLLTWYRGRRDIARHLHERCPVRPGQAELVPVDANGQPAFATYLRRPDGSPQAAFLQVLDVGPEGITHVYAFLDPAVFALFSATPGSVNA